MMFRRRSRPAGFWKRWFRRRRSTTAAERAFGNGLGARRLGCSLADCPYVAAALREAWTRGFLDPSDGLEPDT